MGRVRYTAFSPVVCSTSADPSSWCHSLRECAPRSAVHTHHNFLVYGHYGEKTDMAGHDNFHVNVSDFWGSFDLPRTHGWVVVGFAMTGEMGFATTGGMGIIIRVLVHDYFILDFKRGLSI